MLFILAPKHFPLFSQRLFTESLFSLFFWSPFLVLRQTHFPLTNTRKRNCPCHVLLLNVSKAQRSSWSLGNEITIWLAQGDKEYCIMHIAKLWSNNIFHFSFQSFQRAFWIAIFVFECFICIERFWLSMHPYFSFTKV